jgi:5-methylcytosine-specific restriction protein A
MVWGTKSRHERGYDYAWVKLRRQILARDEGQCQRCKRAGLTMLAQAVDHIVSKAEAARRRWTREQVDHPSNLEAICEPCHLVKTEAEQGKTKRAPKRGVGPDGWPA